MKIDRNQEFIGFVQILFVSLWTPFKFTFTMYRHAAPQSSSVFESPALRRPPKKNMQLVIRRFTAEAGWVETNCQRWETSRWLNFG